jgi:hypothetical protein
MGPHHLGRYRPGPLDSQAGNASGGPRFELSPSPV